MPSCMASSGVIMPVEISLPTTKLWVKRLENSETVLKKTADNVVTELKRVWDKELDPDYKKMEPLTESYAKVKKKIAGNRKVNMKLHGNLQSSLGITSLDKKRVIIGFGSGQKLKAEGLASKRPFMEPGDKFIKKITTWVIEGLRGIK